MSSQTTRPQSRERAISKHSQHLLEFDDRKRGGFSRRLLSDEKNLLSRFLGCRVAAFALRNPSCKNGEVKMQGALLVRSDALGFDLDLRGVGLKRSLTIAYWERHDHVLLEY